MIDQILTNEYFLLALTFGIYQPEFGIRKSL